MAENHLGDSGEGLCEILKVELTIHSDVWSACGMQLMVNWCVYNKIKYKIKN